MKVLKSSGVYDIPWATRVTLEDHLNSELRKEADRVGEKVETVRDRFEAGDPSIHPAQIILDAVRDMAVNDKREEELRAARRRINELEDQVRDMTRTAKVRK